MVNNKKKHNSPGAIIIEGHVQGLSNTRSLGEAGIPVYVVDKSNCIARHSKYCTKFFRCPDFIEDEFAEFLIQIAENENIKDWVLVPSNDHAVYTISKHKNKLEKYYKVITPSLDIIENIYDKLKLVNIAKQINLTVPVTQSFASDKDEISHDLRFPVLTKGRNGLSFYRAVGKKAFLAHNQDELRKQLTSINKKYKISKTLTQELIPLDGSNKTISFTAFCVDGNIKTHWTGIKLREHPINFGTATYAKSIYIKECYQQSISLLKKLNYTGVCEVEYLRDPRDNQYKLIEINARTWLWVGLAKACGIDYAKLIFNYQNNLETVYPDTYILEKFWINPISDFAYAIIAIMSGKLNPIQYINSLLFNDNVNALLYTGDSKPFYKYIFNIVSIIRHR